MQRPGTVGCRQRAEMTYSPVAMVMTRRGWRSWVPASDYTSSNPQPKPGKRHCASHAEVVSTKAPRGAAARGREGASKQRG